MSHALLSPSAAHRWMNCTAAPRIEEKFEDKSSDAAMEGTVAHAICAEMLRELHVDGNFDNCAVKENILINNEISEEDFNAWNCQEMNSYCADYAMFVWANYIEAKKTTPDAELMIETLVDASVYGPGMAGTTDAAIVSDDILHIFDFKYGRGVRVEAEGNPQMMIYALGNILKYSSMYGFEKVKMTIYQPRIDNISTYELSVDLLDEWGETDLTKSANEAYSGKGLQRAGEWCKFCKARGCCKTLKEYNTSDYEKLHNADFEILSDEEIASVISQATEIKSWLQCVEKFALDKLQNGEYITGLKLVEGRSVRKYSDEKAVTELLRKQGFSDEDILDSKLKTITSLTKTLTKKVFDSLLTDYIVKPQGAPTIVSSDDPRQELGANDFDNVDI